MPGQTGPSHETWRLVIILMMMMMMMVMTMAMTLMMIRRTNWAHI